MKILFIAGEYPPSQGGLGDFTRELGRALVAQGHEAHVLTRAVAGAPAREDAPGLPHVRRAVAGWGWSAWQAVSAITRELKPDALNLQYQAAAYDMHPAINLLPWRMQKTARLAVTFHDLRAPYLFPKAGALRERSILGMARNARAAIVTNAEDEATLGAAGVPHVRRIPIGSNITPVPLPGFNVAAWKTARGIPADENLFGYFGFMNESKGGETLIRALADLRGRGENVGLLHIGGKTGASDPTNAAYAQKLESLAESLGVKPHVHETGFVDDRGVSEAFAACFCAALPYRDGASFRRGTIMAAFAHGAAIITTTPRAPLQELRHEQNTLLIPPDSPAALADALARVLRDSSLRARLQAGSAQLHHLFGWDEIARATAQALAAL